MAETIVVDVAWVTEDRAQLRTCTLRTGSCVADVLACVENELASWVGNFSECPVGIFGRVVPRDQPLQNGDRVEIYRALPNDPKTARRHRARQMARRKSG
jgi:putative ubiquitin-RnfH superfamily antitoxin RatB of RatAB toxin-antitoxin module